MDNNKDEDQRKTDDHPKKTTEDTELLLLSKHKMVPLMKMLSTLITNTPRLPISCPEFRLHLSEGQTIYRAQLRKQQAEASRIAKDNEKVLVAMETLHKDMAEVVRATKEVKKG